MARMYDCFCRFHFPKFFWGEKLSGPTAKPYIPMVKSGHGGELVGVVLFRRLRVWWKPAPVYDRKLRIKKGH